MPQCPFGLDPKHHFNSHEFPHDFLLTAFCSSPTDPDAALSNPLAVVLIPLPSQAVIHDLLEPTIYLSQSQFSTSLA
jgi:hypothetical protein